MSKVKYTVPPWVLANLAKDSYTDKPTWETQDLAACLYWYPIPGKGSVPVITIRGTELTSVSNWGLDFEAWPIWSSKIGFCHKGYFTAAQKLHNVISSSTIGSLSNRHVLERSPILNGHSMGGAIALILAARIIFWGDTISNVTTFNAPRPGGRRIQNLIGAFATQYRHKDDVISHWPWWFGLYKDPSELITVGNDVDPLRAHEIVHLVSPFLYTNNRG